MIKEKTSNCPSDLLWHPRLLESMVQEQNAGQVKTSWTNFYWVTSQDGSCSKIIECLFLTTNMKLVTRVRRVYFCTDLSEGLYWPVWSFIQTCLKFCTNMSEVLYWLSEVLYWHVWGFVLTCQKFCTDPSEVLYWLSEVLYWSVWSFVLTCLKFCTDCLKFVLTCLRFCTDLSEVLYRHVWSFILTCLKFCTYLSKVFDLVEECVA